MERVVARQNPKTIAFLEFFQTNDACMGLVLLLWACTATPGRVGLVLGRWDNRPTPASLVLYFIIIIIIIATNNNLPIQRFLGGNGVRVGSVGRGGKVEDTLHVQMTGGVPCHAGNVHLCNDIIETVRIIVVACGIRSSR